MHVELLPSAVRVPERLYAASVSVLERDFAQALARHEPVVVLTGSHPGVFSLGLALDTVGNAHTETRGLADLLLALHRSAKPTIAVVDGQAIGGGLGVAAACDWVIATDSSTFALPELLWGLVPAIVWPVISDRMATHVARQWALSAHTRVATEAAAVGLVDDVAPAAAIGAALRRAERRLARIEPKALLAFRQWTRTSRSLNLAQALEQGADLTASMMGPSAGRERWFDFSAGEAPSS